MSNPIKFCFVLDRGKNRIDLQWGNNSWSNLPKSLTINYPRKKQIRRKQQSEQIIRSKHWTDNEKHSRDWGPAPIDKIFDPEDSEKKTLSGGKMRVNLRHERERRRPKTPPALIGSSRQGFSYQSSTIARRQKVVKVSNRRGKRNRIQMDQPLEGNLEISRTDKSSFDMSLNKSNHSINSKQEKLVNMIQKIVVKIDEECEQSCSGKFKFRNKDLGNCFVILSENKNHLLGVFVEEDYNERLAYNFLEELEIILISFQE